MLSKKWGRLSAGNADLMLNNIESVRPVRANQTDVMSPMLPICAFKRSICGKYSAQRPAYTSATWEPCKHCTICTDLLGIVLDTGATAFHFETRRMCSFFSIMRVPQLGTNACADRQLSVGQFFHLHRCTLRKF